MTLTRRLRALSLTVGFLLGLWSSLAGAACLAAAPIPGPAVPATAVPAGAAVENPALPVAGPPPTLRQAPGLAGPAVWHPRARVGTRPADSTPLNLPPYRPAADQSTATDTGGLLALAAKFAVVLALLYGCLRVLRFIMPRLGGPGGATGALVLHGETIGEKQKVLLLDLGVRLVLVGTSGTTISPLATIDDAAEMAVLRERFGAKTGPARGRSPSPSVPAAPLPSAPAAPLQAGFADVLRDAVAAPADPLAQSGAGEGDSDGGVTASLTSRAPTRRRAATSLPSPAAVEAPGEGDPVLEDALQTVRGLRRRAARR